MLERVFLWESEKHDLMAYNDKTNIKDAKGVVLLPQTNLLFEYERMRKCILGMTADCHKKR